MDAETPTGGRDKTEIEIKGFALEKRRTFHQRHPGTA
jgi:hypothetical protein